MQSSESQSPESHRSRRPEQLTILELMILIVGVAVGLWLVTKDVTNSGSGANAWLCVVVGVLGGLSAIGPLLLLLELRERRIRWGAGRVLWFALGMASWLLWPPLIYHRAWGSRGLTVATGEVWVCTTPLMAIYVMFAMLAGGWIKRASRRRQRSWREQFGLLLGIAWACTGSYIMYTLYMADFRNRAQPAAGAPQTQPVPAAAGGTTQNQ